MNWPAQPWWWIKWKITFVHTAWHIKPQHHRPQWFKTPWIMNIGLEYSTVPRAWEGVSEWVNGRANARVAHYIPISRFPSSESMCTMGRITMKLGHSLIHSLIFSHGWLICLHCTARFTCVLHCAHLLAHSLTCSWANGNKIHFYELNVSIWYSCNPQCSVVLDKTWKSVLIRLNFVLYCFWPLGLWNDSLKTALGLYPSLIQGGTKTRHPWAPHAPILIALIWGH